MKARRVKEERERKKDLGAEEVGSLGSLGSGSLPEGFALGSSGMGQEGISPEGRQEVQTPAQPQGGGV